MRRRNKRRNTCRILQRVLLTGIHKRPKRFRIILGEEPRKRIRLIIMQDSKNIISLRLEQSRVSEKIEELRQLILLSTLPQTRILRLNDTLDIIQVNVDGGYEDKFMTQKNVGNI